MPINVFMCYAHEDEKLLNNLVAHLRPLEWEGLIKLWCDRDIIAGSEPDREISEHLNAAQIILLLVSSDFIALMYESTEVKQALERHDRAGVRVIPIILRHVAWQDTPLGKLQALPKQSSSVVTGSLPTMDHAFEDVVKDIRKAVLAYPKAPEEQARRTTDTTTASRITADNGSIQQGQPLDLGNGQLQQVGTRGLQYQAQKQQRLNAQDYVSQLRASQEAISSQVKQVSQISPISSDAIKQILVLIKRVVFLIFGSTVYIAKDLIESDKGVQGLICLSLDVVIISVPLWIHFSWWVAVPGLPGTVLLFGIGRSELYGAFTLLKAFIIAAVFGFLWSLMLWLVLIKPHGEPIFTSLLAYLIIGAAFFIGSFINFIQF